MDQADTIKLHQILISRFDEDELKTFCFYLNVPFHSLPGDTLSGKARELILHYERRNQLIELITVGKELRPDILWDDLFIKPRIEESQNKAQINIRFEAEDEPIVARAVDAGYQLAVFYRLTIDNLSDKPIRDCRGILAAVEPLADTKSSKLGRPVMLKWAHEEGYVPITIEAGESRKLDLIIIFINFTEFFEFFVDQPHFAGMSRRFPAGIYLVTIRIMSNDTKVAQASFIVETDGQSPKARIQEKISIDNEGET